MTEKALPRIRLSGAGVAPLLSIVTPPIILLNVFSGVGSAIWLAVLGEWSVLRLGLVFALMAPLVIVAAYWRCAWDQNMLAGYQRILAFLITGIIGTNSVVTVLCVMIFYGDTVQSQPDDFWPLLLWSYAQASGSLTIARFGAGYADGPAIEVCTTFFAQLALVPVIIAVLFFNPTLIQLFMIFGSVMIVCCLVQLVDYVRTFPKVI